MSVQNKIQSLFMEIQIIPEFLFSVCDQCWLEKPTKASPVKTETLQL